MTIAAFSVILVLAGAPAAAPATPAPATAAPTPADRAAVLAKWTQASAASAREWSAARRDRTAWVAYDFVWTTDDCSGGPERPLGFDFRQACRRHDFGYRNYRATGGFKAAKPRLDRAFHADLRRSCATYRPAVRPICHALAWTYYRATRRFAG